MLIVEVVFFLKVSGPLLADPVKINYNFVPISEIR